MAPILANLREIVAARAGRDRSLVSLVWLLCARLARFGRRLDAMAGRLAAGRPAVRVRAAVRPAARGDRAAPAGPRLPRDDAWLLRRIPEARAMGTQLAALLAEPEMAALLAAEPALVRLLRPLGRLLDFALPDAVPAPAAVVAAAGEPARSGDPAAACVAGVVAAPSTVPAAGMARAPPRLAG